MAGVIDDLRAKAASELQDQTSRALKTQVAEAVAAEIQPLLIMLQETNARLAAKETAPQATATSPSVRAPQTAILLTQVQKECRLAKDAVDKQEKEVRTMFAIVFALQVIAIMVGMLGLSRPVRLEGEIAKAPTWGQTAPGWQDHAGAPSHSQRN